MGYFFSWLASKVLNSAHERLLAQLFPDKVRDSLIREIEKWAAELPADSLLASGEALFPKVPQVAVATEPPKARAAIEKLAKYEIPSASDWASALSEQWRWVKQTISDPQPFFTLDEDQVTPLIATLAERLETECRKNVDLSHVHTSRRVDELTDGLRSLPERVASLVRQSPELLGNFRTVELLTRDG